ncbi:MAG TPA: hypothetical protein VF599_03220 [Pyrinomonadaceae bacterium]|jgi:hypothetical protein
MKIKFFAVACLMILTAFGLPCAAQNDSAKFRFNPKKIEVGTVYHYVKTNVDGTKPEYVSQYVAAPDKLEAFKFHPRGSRAALVIATMDWTIFSARRLESWQVFAAGKKNLFATLDYSGAAKAVDVSIPSTGKPSEKTAIEQLPFHVYNFDFGSLNFAFRHLANPKTSFIIGVADPTFKDNPLFVYRGAASVRYEGKETRGGVKCRKYRIDGAGLENRGGWIWVNEKLGHIEDMEIALADNPEWTSFKFKLLKTEKMTRDQWENFMKAQFS